MLSTLLAEIIRESQINAEISELYPAIVRELRREGECKVIFRGRFLEFQMDIRDCEVYIDGRWIDTFTHHCQIRELLEDIVEGG